jgi:hypothetical protein
LMLRKAKDCALDRLLERFGGKGGRGLTVELSRRRDNLPSVWGFYLPRSSPVSERKARMVKFRRCRENMQGRTDVRCRAKEAPILEVTRGEIVEAELDWGEA